MLQEKNLFTISLVCSLVCISNAEANIISTTLVTPLTTNPYDQTQTYTWESLSLDVNSDGLADLQFNYDSILANPYDGHTDAFATVGPRFISGGGVAANLVPIAPNMQTYVATNFAQGSMIDSSSLYELNNAPFAANVFDHYNYSRDANYGNWANNGQGNTGFMGFSFTDSLGLLHYAWADIGISPYQDGNLFSYRISVYGYAYETLANDGILAGATINASPVPVPSAIWMFGSSLVGFVGFNRRKAIQQ